MALFAASKSFEKVDWENLKQLIKSGKQSYKREKVLKQNEQNQTPVHVFTVENQLKKLISVRQ